MARYIIRRGIQSIFLTWLATLIGFTVYQMAPGGPLQFLDDDPKATAADATRLAQLYGIDRSIPVQYVAWLAGEDWLPESWQSGHCQNDPNRCSWGIIRLDFGKSFYFKGQSSIALIVERMPATFVLAASSLLISVVVGVPLGIIAALRRGRMADHTIRVTTVIINTVPEWWIGLLLLIFLGAYLGLVP